MPEVKNLPAQQVEMLSFLDGIGDFFKDAVNTVKDFFDVGKHVKNIVDDALDPANDLIDHADETLKGLLEEINTSIDGILHNLSETYQDNLNITIDSLDNVTRNKILEVLSAMEQVNELLQENIKLAGETAKDVLSNAGLQIKQAGAELEENLKNVIFVAGETVNFVVDKVIYNIITLASWILLGVGLLVTFGILVKRGLPEGLAGTLAVILLALFVILFGALALVPKFRTTIMRFTGLGLKQRLETAAAEPHIFDIRPRIIMLGTTQELDVFGANLLIDGKAPNAITIGGQPCAIKASSSAQLSLDVSSLNVPTGSTNLIMRYDNEQEARFIVKIDKPVPKLEPDLIVDSFRLNPASPEEDRSAIATIRIRNRGKGDATKGFIVRWKPHDRHPGITRNIPDLEAGKTTQFDLDFTYPTPGNFSSIVSVDVLNRVDEANEANNVLTRNIKVLAHQPRRIASKSFKVDLNGRAVNTGISVEPGDRIRIETPGKAVVKILSIKLSFSADGHQIRPDGRGLLLSSAKTYAMLFKIGNRNYQKAGALFDGIVRQKGRLELRTNTLSSSSGSATSKVNFTTHVQVWR